MLTFIEWNNNQTHPAATPISPIQPRPINYEHKYHDPVLPSVLLQKKTWTYRLLATLSLQFLAKAGLVKTISNILTLPLPRLSSWATAWTAHRPLGPGRPGWEWGVRKSFLILIVSYQDKVFPGTLPFQPSLLQGRASLREQKLYKPDLGSWIYRCRLWIQAWSEVGGR